MRFCGAKTKDLSIKYKAMLSNPKKVAAIHDIAGFGRSSLTVVMPTLSVMGHQACPAPTAVLSSITGYYEGYAMRDMTDFLSDCFRHWQEENCKFDCIYTGFIGSARGVRVTESFVEKAGAPLLVVDPVFADDGRRYDCFDESIIDPMRSLIRKADIITPNLTEACFLTDTPQGGDMETAKCALSRLAEMVKGSVLITGVPLKNTVAVLMYDAADNTVYQIQNPYIHMHYPGTGDLFTAVLTGARLSGEALPKAASRAADFVFHAISAAKEAGVPQREGVPMEMLVHRLTKDHYLSIEKIDMKVREF